jgi:hypothetical protein
MHPDIAYSLGELRRAEFLAEAAHQRLIREAKGPRVPRTKHRGDTPQWWGFLLSASKHSPSLSTGRR